MDYFGTIESRGSPLASPLIDDAPEPYSPIGELPSPWPSAGRIESRIDHEFFCKDTSSASSFQLALRCKSRARVAKNRPVYFDGDVIEGGVQMTVRSPTYVQKITIEIRGRISPPDVGVLDVFWSTMQVPWDASSENRSRGFRSPISPGGSKLMPGSYCWDFSVHLPSEVPVRTGSGPKSYPLPPNFWGKGLRAAVLEYDIAITVHRGVYRDTPIFSVPFVFLPRSSPQWPFGKPRMHDLDRLSPPPSHQWNASTEGEGMAQDLWKSLQMTQEMLIEGKIFANRVARVRCWVMNVKPLIYPRGEPIHVTIALESDDPEALHIMTTSDCFTIALEQKVVVGGSNEWETALAKGEISSPVSSTDANLRILHATVDCPSDTKPSFDFSRFVLAHFLKIQFTPSSFFTPLSKTKRIPPLRQSVKIVTDPFLPD